MHKFAALKWGIPATWLLIANVYADPSALAPSVKATAQASHIELAQAEPSKEEPILRELHASEDPLENQTIEAALPEPSTEAELPKEEAIERELDAGEDPLAKQTVEKENQRFYKYRDHTAARANASVRARYSTVDEQEVFDDGGSRIGLSGELQFHTGYWLLGRAEIGFNVFNSIDLLKNGFGQDNEDTSNASARLLYGGVQTSTTTLTYGKNWSSYYQVAGLTDRFESFGGDASGAFNANTDGGPSGTGRADNVLQGRFSINGLPERWRVKPFKLNVQLQQGEDIPQVDNAQYTASVGISALLETKSGQNTGIAYNHAFIDKADLPTLRAKGMGGDSKAFLIGTRRFGDRYYVGSTLSFLENQETTDEGIYFDGWGWEVFASYNVRKRWWLIGGWNNLQPYKNEELASDYHIRYGVIGLRYSFDQFRRMIFAETRLDNSRSVGGSAPGNIYNIGVRWDF